jgi:hypothetical protein
MAAAANKQCESILRARARFHAAWWDDLRLGASVGNWLDTRGLDHYLQKLSLALPTALVTSCHASGAIFRNYCSARRPVYSNAITRTVTSRSSRATRTSGIASCRGAGATTCGCSIGMAGALTRPRTTSPNDGDALVPRPPAPIRAGLCWIVIMRRWWHTACAVMIAPRWMMITGCRRYGRSRRPCGRRQATYLRWSGGTTWNAACWPLKISDAAIFWSDDGAPSVPTLASSATHNAPQLARPCRLGRRES